MIELRPVEGVPTPHEVPLATIMLEGTRIAVELDDAQSQRFRLVFRTYQAMRVTTADCFDLPEEVEFFPKELVEVIRSPWIHELREVLARTDETATFLDKARHFLIPAGDDYIEVVAWEIECQSIPRI